MEWIGYSNNIMDYSPLQVAWTPCQINIIHSAIENGREILYPCGFSLDSLSITSNFLNKNRVLFTKSLTVSEVIVPENKALYIYCETFKTIGEFEIKEGAIFEVNSAPKCN